MSRMAMFYILTGSNGTGKTYQLKKLLEVNRKNETGRNLIFPANQFDKAWARFKKVKPKREWVDNPNPNKKQKISKWHIPKIASFRGDLVVDLSDVHDTADRVAIFDSICVGENRYDYGGLFVDDFKGYIPSKGNLRQPIKDMFIGRRHRMLDIFIVSHMYEDVNREFFGWGPSLAIFDTTLPPNDNALSKIGRCDEFLAQFARVKDKNRNLPEGKKYYFEIHKS